MKCLGASALTTLALVSSSLVALTPARANNIGDRHLNSGDVVAEITSDRGVLAQLDAIFGGGVTYITSRAIADNLVEVTWEYQGKRYTFQSTVGSYYIKNQDESRDARGGERDVLRKAYDAYKQSNSNRPGTPVGGGITYISSRQIGDRTLEVTWDYRGNRYSYQSDVDSYYIRNRVESRQARRGGEREALRIAYDEFNRNNSSNNSDRLLKARSAYDTILVDKDANFVVGIPRGSLIYVKCSDIQRIEGDKRVFAMDSSGKQGYILTNAVSGATCNW
jgi:hypothetical protein